MFLDMEIEGTPVNNQDNTGPQEIKMPTLSETVIQEFGQQGGRFKEIDLDDEKVYAENRKPEKAGRFPPDTRFFVFPESVLEVDSPDIKELFMNNDLDFLRMLKGKIPKDIDETKYSSLIIENYNGAEYAIKYYRSTNGDDRKKVISILRERNSKKQ